MDMVSTTIPSPGRASAMNIPTSGVGASRALNKSRDRRQQSAELPDGPDDAAANVRGAHHQQQQHPASAFYFANDEDVVGTPQPPTTELPAPPPAPVPEPGGGEVGGMIHKRAQQEFPEPAGVASRSPYDRPWRKRAREARRATSFRNTEGFEEEGGGGTGAMRRRASQKETVVALRKESQQKAITRAALPIVDLVGVVSPLVLLVGITLVQNVP